MVDIVDGDNIIHIKVDSSHIQKDMNLSTFMMEQMINDTYQGVTITKDYNSYGLLTDIWIEFLNPTDAIHFKLKNYFN